jgi:REP element-mobilizing transposase RayT
VLIYKDKPPRLTRILTKSELYFVTFCTWQRTLILARPSVQTALLRFGANAEEHSVALGRYVLMPDHMHLFAAPGLEGDLGRTIKLLKRALSAALTRDGVAMPHWQPGFFDRLLRSSDSYSAKWEYVRNNPVRAGLVTEADHWPFQGEIAPIDW